MGILQWLSAALEDAVAAATRIAAGPTFANGMEDQLHQQWNMSVDQAIECEAQAQAVVCRLRIFVAPTMPS